MEEASAKFYEGLAQCLPADAEALLGYAAVNKKNVSNVERAYFGVITDALEGCYAFDLEPEEYAIDVELPQEVGRADALAKALVFEQTIMKFYVDAAEQSKGLMADVPRAFSFVARKRGERIEELKGIAAA